MRIPQQFLFFPDLTMIYCHFWWFINKC